MTPLSTPSPHHPNTCTAVSRHIKRQDPHQSHPSQTTPTNIKNSHPPPGTRGFYGGLVTSGVVSGVLLGAAVGTLLRETLSPAALQRYGFRIPFLCGFLVALAGLALHKYVPDMSAVEAETGPGDDEGSTEEAATSAAVNAAEKPNPLKELFADHKLELCFGTSVLFLYCTTFYECLVSLAVRDLDSCRTHSIAWPAFVIVSLALIDRANEHKSSHKHRRT